MKIKTIILTIFCVLFFSCNGKDELNIVLDNSQPLALAPDVFWAVITEPYVAYKEEKSWTSNGTGHCRLGDIIQVQGKSSDKENKIWYLFEEGWVSEDCVTVFNNRYKAKTLSESLLNEKK